MTTTMLQLHPSVVPWKLNQKKIKSQKLPTGRVSRLAGTSPTLLDGSGEVGRASSSNTKLQAQDNGIWQARLAD